MGQIKKHHLSILLLAVIVSISCANQEACIRNNDASEMPYTSFIHITSDTMVLPDACDETEKQIFGQCLPQFDISTGSGVIIAKSTTSTTTKYVLTANHICAQRNKEVSGTKLGHRFVVRDFNDVPHYASFVLSADKFDACILSFDDDDDSLAVAPIAERNVKLGAVVYNLGAPHSVFSGGMVLTFHGMFSGDLEDKSVFTIPAAPGSSGSPVFNEKGEVISMIWGVPVEELRIADVVIGRRQLLENLAFGLTFKQLLEIRDALFKFDAKKPTI